jgi:hypothetical protein
LSAATHPVHEVTIAETWQMLPDVDAVGSDVVFRGSPRLPPCASAA